ncbi:YceI family protein [Lysobacter panacisoli]|uniref:YceI family protein n=1 Tax=Lysobacter panacisoli TaxID=1255263 RepID=A0ABP9LPT4_9GAMM|nr:YceI family protein [Lysobacter panacisoli]
MPAFRFALRSTLSAALAAACSVAAAAPAVYEIDPAHTFPSFEADHMGMSSWRGKFNGSSGEIALDKAAGKGSVKVVIDASSIDFGLDAMNDKARGDELFDTAKFPQATYTGTLADFRDGMPTKVRGQLTLHGVTRPLDLDIARFKCMPHPLNKRDWCGADASATFRRDEFGIDAGKDWGFDMNVTLRIQVEAVAKQ